MALTMVAGISTTPRIKREIGRWMLVGGSPGSHQGAESRYEQGLMMDRVGETLCRHFDE